MFITTPDGPVSADTETAAAAPVKPKRVRKASAKKKIVKKKKAKTVKKKTKSKAAKKAKKRTAPKKVKSKKPAKARNGGPARSERLDMRITKADKAKLAAKSKKLGIPVTEVVLKAIAKLK